jgi:hypothetical protein
LRKEAMEGYRELHNEELHNLCYSRNSIGVIKLRVRWVGHVECTEAVRNMHKILVRKPEGKRPLGKPRCR